MYALRGLSAVAITAALVIGPVGQATATEGYFAHGFGARHKALGGAGVADSRDATAAALNPAGLVHVRDQANISVSLFSPRREFTGSGGFTPAGTVESDSIFFGIPNFAVSFQLQNNPFADVVALTVYGNGGMNTNYPAVANPACVGPLAGGTGIFCGGKLGVNLSQVFISAAAAKRFGNVSVGIAPIFALQMFEANGLRAFAGASSAPGAVTNNGIDYSFGGGLRAGIEYAPLSNVRLGVAGNTRIYMSELDDYRGLFAEQGDFDIPASIQAGIAIDLSPSLTVMADYKYIWYSGIAAINNPSGNIVANCVPGPAGGTGPGCLGANNGAGFGWEDINIIKLGLEWRPTESTALRLGYAYNENPIQSADVMFNILAPGVVKQHFTAGGKFALNNNWDMEISGMYVPETSVIGNELGAPFGAGAGATVEIAMKQYEVTVGLTYKFGQ